MNFELLLWAAGLVVTYALVANRLFAAGRPLRDRLLQVAAELSHDERISAERRRELVRCSRLSVSRTAAWAIVISIPLAFLKSISRNAAVDMYEGIPSDRHAAWADFNKVFVPATLTASPAAMGVALVFFGVITFFASFAMISLILVPRVVDRMEHGLWHTGRRGVTAH